MVFDLGSAQPSEMKPFVLLLTILVAALLVATILWPQDARLIWNRTASAPIGLYWLSDVPLHKGQWVVVSARSAEAQWAEARGFVGADWPLIKQIAGLEGDQICRDGDAVAINGARVGWALRVDNLGRAMPAWHGCFVLQRDEIFLMNPHPASLDGRQFGAMRANEIDGAAQLILEAGE
jgi:conjugative transfer signal peptidase TraF